MRERERIVIGALEIRSRDGVVEGDGIFDFEKFGSKTKVFVFSIYKILIDLRSPQPQKSQQ